MDRALGAGVRSLSLDWSETSHCSTLLALSGPVALSRIPGPAEPRIIIFSIIS